MLTLFFLCPQVIFRALSPRDSLRDPYSPEALAQLTLTNLRIRLLKSCPAPVSRQSNPPGRDPAPSPLYGLLAGGTCHCHGHAGRCQPFVARLGMRPHGGMVRRVCVCCVWRVSRSAQACMLQVSILLFNVRVAQNRWMERNVMAGLCPGGRCRASVCAHTTQRESTARGAPPSSTTGPGDLPTGAAGSPTPARVSVPEVGDHRCHGRDMRPRHPDLAKNICPVQLNALSSILDAHRLTEQLKWLKRIS